MLRQLPEASDSNLLVGFATRDDAAVYRLDDDTALVQTVDFFPPIVDDPFAYGAIAAANSFSDVYAMGGTPLLAMSIVGFPMGLSNDLLAQILKGGASKAEEAGVLVVGGHTVDDREPKYGMAVTGLVRPGEQVTNAGAKPGDALVLTKPIGTGVITTAAKDDRAPTEIVDRAIEVMSALNEEASHAMTEVGVNACVDVTGFGLLGHLMGMLRAGDVAGRIDWGPVPLLEGVRELADRGIAPGGTHRNLEWLDPDVRWHPDLSMEARVLLCDAQTSGGLLISVSADRLDALLNALEVRGVRPAAVVGEIVEKGALDGRRILVTP